MKCFYAVFNTNIQNFPVYPYLEPLKERLSGDLFGIVMRKTVLSL